MMSIEITFAGKQAVITTTTATELTIQRVKYQTALLWMSKQGKPWTWITLEDGTEQATWSRD